MKPETHILENLDIFAVLNISCENLRMQNKLTKLTSVVIQKKCLNTCSMIQHYLSTRSPQDLQVYLDKIGIRFKK